MDLLFKTHWYNHLIMRLSIRHLTRISLLSGCLILLHATRLYSNPSINVEWSTASELEVAGFNILRADNPDGPFVQINETLVPSSDDPLTGGEYLFEDFNVAGGARYFYQLQEVELSGAVIIHGPVEVEATRGGTAEAVLAGVLIIGSIVILTQTRQRP